MTSAPPPTLNVIARAPFQIYYEGPALSVSAKNRVGEFDILPGHADFFSMLSPCTVAILTEKDEITFEIYSGMLTVKSNEALLFVNM